MQILINIFLVLEVIVALLIILLTLMQRPKNEGLGAAFGGGMTENIFGAQTTNVLQKLTRNLGITFFILTTALSWLYVKTMHVKSEAQRQLEAVAPLPVATPAPTPAPNAPLEAGKSKAPSSPGPSAVSQPVKVGDSPAPKAGATPAPTPAPKPAATPAAPATPAPTTATPKPDDAKPATPAPAPNPPQQ